MMFRPEVGQRFWLDESHFDLWYAPHRAAPKITAAKSLHRTTTTTPR
jgi:hypothetical protein